MVQSRQLVPAGFACEEHEVTGKAEKRKENEFIHNPTAKNTSHPVTFLLLALLDFLFTGVFELDLAGTFNTRANCTAFNASPRTGWWQTIDVNQSN
jgi:hypothetical protein